LKEMPRSQYFLALLVAVLGSGATPFLITTAQTQINSALTGLLNSLTPLFTFFFGVLFFQTFFQTRRFIGVLLGLAGALMLIVFSAPLKQSGNNSYALFVVVATMCYAMNANTIKKYCQNLSPFSLNAIGFLWIGPISAIFLANTDVAHRIQYIPNALWGVGYVAILGLLGTAVANVLYFRLTQITDALFASMVTYLIPVISIAWGLWDGEIIDASYLIGMALILGGVYLASRK
jgi:drug/metabolite transporter (DMT)-like permease